MINGLPFSSRKESGQDAGCAEAESSLSRWYFQECGAPFENDRVLAATKWPPKVQVIIIFVQIFSTSKTAFQDTLILWPHTMTQSTSYQSFKHILNDFNCSLLREDWLEESVQRYPNFRLFLDYYRGFPIETWNVHDMLVHHNSTLEIHLYNWWIINLNMVTAFIDGR